jgi:ankyrin repeat protein
MAVDGMKALRAIMPLGLRWRPLAAELGVRPTQSGGRVTVSTGIYDAAVLGDFETVKAILNQHPEAVNEPDEYGFTPLHGLAEEEHLDIARYLIERGANVNASNDEGITPLHLAAWPAMAALLLTHGARLDATDQAGRTPLLVLAEEPDREDVIELLLKAGADVNAAARDGSHALDIAILREEDEKASLLRRYGGRQAAAQAQP